MIKSLLTRGLTKIPLFWIDFNLKHFRLKGKENSCVVHIHPNFKNDQHIIDTLNDLIDYVRDNYDMKNI